MLFDLRSWAWTGGTTATGILLRAMSLGPVSYTSSFR